MKLKDWTKELNYALLQGSLSEEVNEVVYDSRKIVPDCLFICIEGAKFDGHDYAAEVVEKGAKVLIVSRAADAVAEKDVTIIKVKDTRYAMACISAAWFGHPAEKLKISCP